jgi:hypothetical protein
VSVNGPKAVAPGEHGLMTFDWPAWVRYDSNVTADWGHIFGEQSGVSDQWTLYRLVPTTGASITSNESTGGFLCLGLTRENPARALFEYSERHRTYPWIRFTLDDPLDTSTSVVNATFKAGWGGGGGCAQDIEVYNVPDDENPGSYIFSGSAGATGLAVADYLNSTRYRIVWVKC